MSLIIELYSDMIRTNAMSDKPRKFVLSLYTVIMQKYCGVTKIVTFISDINFL